MALDDYDQPEALPELNPEFAEMLIESFNSQDRLPVSQLFNEWWRFSPQSVAEKYRRLVCEVPGFSESFEERYFAPPLDLDGLLAMQPGTLGPHLWRLHQR